MLPTPHLPALAAAERALDRLDGALADPGPRRRHVPNVVRRAAVAMARLDGAPVTADELALAAAAAAAECVAPGPRAAVLARLALDIEDGSSGPAVAGFRRWATLEVCRNPPAPPWATPSMRAAAPSRSRCAAIPAWSAPAGR